MAAMLCHFRGSLREATRDRKHTRAVLNASNCSAVSLHMHLKVHAHAVRTGYYVFFETLVVKEFTYSATCNSAIT